MILSLSVLYYIGNIIRSMGLKLVIFRFCQHRRNITIFKSYFQRTDKFGQAIRILKTDSNLSKSKKSRIQICF